MKWIVENLDFVANWSSVIGLIVTFVGFFITIVNVLKSKRAAEEARAAAHDAKEKLGFLDVIAEIGIAKERIREIQALQRASSWDRLPDKYQDLRNSIIIVRDGSKSLTKEHIQALQSALASNNQHVKMIDKFICNQSSIKNVVGMNEILTEQSDKLLEILIEIKRGIE